MKHLNKKQSTFIYEWDQATDDTPGSTEITATIIAKISTSQIVISDVTVIPKKEFPNPNIMFELGFAVAKLGWGRIISLMNTNEGYSPQTCLLTLEINVSRHIIPKKLMVRKIWKEQFKLPAR